MNDLSDIKRRLRSVRQTRQITKAVETVSVVKMCKLMERHETDGEYFSFLKNIMRSVLACGDAEVANLITPPNNGRPLVLVIASDNGLCGSYNNDVFKLASTVIDEETIVVPVGATAVQRFTGKNYNVVSDFVSCSYNSEHTGSKAISEYILSHYGRDVKSVSVVYTKQLSKSNIQPEIYKLLPISSGSKHGHKLEFEPSAPEVFKRLVPMYIECEINQALINSAISEHCARRNAMSSATKNADDIIDALTIEYNRARQSTVTEQITEMIGSRQALGSMGDGQ